MKPSADKPHVELRGGGQSSGVNLIANELRARRNAYFCLAIFIAALALVYVPSKFDIPVERAINACAGRSAALDMLFYFLDTYYTFSGVVLVALVWSCWFADRDRELRARVLVGIAACCAAGALSRVMQHELPSHPRPLYDPALDFHLPPTSWQTPPFNTWDSFPSDHASVFFGLIAVISLARPGSACSHSRGLPSLRPRAPTWARTIPPT